MENEDKSFSPIQKIVVGIAVVIAISAIGYRYFHQKSVEQDQAQQEIKQELSDLKTSEAQKSDESQNKIDDLTQKLISVQSQPQPVTTPQSSDMDAIINKWKPSVAMTLCQFGQDYFQGSATIFSDTNGIYALTNKHIVEYQGYGPNGCSVLIPEIGYRIVYFDSTKNNFPSFKDYDVGFISLDSSATQTDNLSFNTNAKESSDVCNPNDVSLGDSVVVLGYPYDGSQQGITVTKGVISGSDGSYYVTDAKIDHGNSGGAAILVKKNCWLGIPSAAVTGQIESYGRILSARYIFYSN